MKKSNLDKNTAQNVFLSSFKWMILSFFIFGPITGMVLDGYSLEYFPQRPVYLSIAVFVASLVLGLYKVIKPPKKIKKTSVAVGGTFLGSMADNPKKQLALIFASFILLSVLPFTVDKYTLTILITAFIYVLLGLGLNIVVGFAGLLDLGFVAFYAIGAYGYALAHQYLGLGFFAAIPLAAIVAGLFGAILGFPVLRMHGDYLAIVTLGFGEIIRLVLTNWVEVTGGPNGIRAPYINFFGVEFTRRAKHGGTPFHELVGIDYNSSYRYIAVYLILLLVVCAALFAVVKIKNISIGRAWEALREDEIACRSLGINHVSVKLSAFSMGASIGGIAGVFFAAFQGFINPTSFTFFESALILAIVVLGGLGSIPGVVMAAVILTALPEFLRDFGDFRVFVFGVLMVVMMIVKPRGLLKIRRPDYAKSTLRDGSA